MLPAERRRPSDARATPGRTSDPLASSKGRTQHANATGRAAAPTRRQGVHPTPSQAARAAHSGGTVYYCVVCEVACERLYCLVMLCCV